MQIHNLAIALQGSWVLRDLAVLLSHFGDLRERQKHLLRVEEMQRADWLICKYTSTFVA